MSGVERDEWVDETHSALADGVLAAFQAQIAALDDGAWVEGKSAPILGKSSRGSVRFFPIPVHSSSTSIPQKFGAAFATCRG